MINSDDLEPILRLVAPDERLHVVAKASDHRILVTDRRIAVAEDDRITLDIPIGKLRRIEFDIEKGRPATLILVPERPSEPPKPITVPVEDYPHVAQALAVLSELLVRGLNAGRSQQDF